MQSTSRFFRANLGLTLTILIIITAESLAQGTYPVPSPRPTSTATAFPIPLPTTFPIATVWPSPTVIPSATVSPSATEFPSPTASPSPAVRPSVSPTIIPSVFPTIFPSSSPTPTPAIYDGYCCCGAGEEGMPSPCREKLESIAAEIIGQVGLDGPIDLNLPGCDLEAVIDPDEGSIDVGDNSCFSFSLRRGGDWSCETPLPPLPGFCDGQLLLNECESGFTGIGIGKMFGKWPSMACYEDPENGGSKCTGIIDFGSGQLFCEHYENQGDPNSLDYFTAKCKFTAPPDSACPEDTSFEFTLIDFEGMKANWQADLYCPLIKDMPLGCNLDGIIGVKNGGDGSGVDSILSCRLNTPLGQLEGGIEDIGGDNGCFFNLSPSWDEIEERLRRIRQGVLPW